MTYTIIRPLRVITSPDAKRLTLIIQWIALDSFIAVRPSKDVINLYRTLKTSGSNVLSTVNFFTHNKVPGCVKVVT